MTANIIDFPIGLRCRLSDLGMARSPRTRMTTGTVVGRGRHPNTVRVLFDGSATPVHLHTKYIEPISAALVYSSTKRPRDIAERSGEQRDLRKLAEDVFLRETFT